MDALTAVTSAAKIGSFLIQLERRWNQRRKKRAPDGGCYYEVCSVGDDSWKLGLFGNLSRIRGYVLLFVVCLILFFIGYIFLPATWYFIIFGALFFIATFFSWVFFRDYFQRNQIRHALYHSLSHEIRDGYNQIIAGKKMVTNYEMASFLANACELIVKIASNEKRAGEDVSIKAAIRLMRLDENNKRVYETVARSRGFNPNRNKTSQPIGENEGIPKSLQEKGCAGVLLIHDKDRAVRDHILKTTNNERDYWDEALSMAVAPLNAPFSYGLIGMLYVVSNRRFEFSEKDVAWVANVADQVVLPVLALKCFDEVVNKN